MLALLLLLAGNDLAEFQRLDKAQRAAPRDAAVVRAWLEEAGRLATLAAGHLESGRFTDARTLLRAVERPLANAPSWNNLLGYAEFKLDNPKPALHYLQRALQMEPENEDYLLDVGEFLGHYRAHDEAVKVFEVALKRMPASLRVRFGLAVAYLMQNLRDLAQSLLERLLAEQPRMEPVYKALGECYEDAANADAMIALGRKLQQVNGRNPLGYYLEGAGLLQAARREAKAVEASLPVLQRAVTMEPANSRARFHLARAFEETGRDADAIEQLKATVKIDPQHERAHYVLGRLYQKSGQPDLSRQELEAHRNIKERDRNAQYEQLLITLKER